MVEGKVPPSAVVGGLQPKQIVLHLRLLQIPSTSRQMRFSRCAVYLTYTKVN